MGNIVSERTFISIFVHQYLQRIDVVWNFSDSGIEESETPEQACIKEVKDETGYVVVKMKLLFKKSYKYTYIADITGMKLYIDSENEENSDIIDIAQIAIDVIEKFDRFSTSILKLLNDQK